jgi:hypothetical protein
MATLPFAVDALPAETDTEPLPRLALAWTAHSELSRRGGKSSRFAPDPSAPSWRRPTANNFDWQRVRVGHREEKTCTVCGETTTTNYCVRCGRVTPTGEIIGAGTKLVKTLDYLHDGEYEIK